LDEFQSVLAKGAAFKIIKRLNAPIQLAQDRLAKSQVFAELAISADTSLICGAFKAFGR
jgi:hypothetical protein